MIRRKYYPIWVKLKAEGKVTIRVHNRMKQLTIKALYEEKRMDLAFRLEFPYKQIHAEKGELQPDGKHLEICFSLVDRVRYKGIELEELTG